MTKDVVIQTDNTFSEYSLYHTYYSKNVIILESHIQEYSTQIQE